MAVAAGSALRPERISYPNGLVLLHNRAAANPSVVVRALVRVYGRQQKDEENG